MKSVSGKTKMIERKLSTSEFQTSQKLHNQKTQYAFIRKFIPFRVRIGVAIRKWCKDSYVYTGTNDQLREYLNSKKPNEIAEDLILAETKGIDARYLRAPVTTLEKRNKLEPKIHLIDSTEVFIAKFWGVSPEVAKMAASAVEKICSPS